MPQLTIQQAYQLAVQHHQSGRPREAEMLYRQILAHQPGHADALHMLGMLAGQIGRTADAIDLIGRAIQLSPRSAEFHANLGVALAAAGKMDDAIAAFSQALALRADYFEAQYNLARTLADAKQWDAAVNAFGRAVSLQPGFAEAHFGLGNALRVRGQFDEAAAAYRRALAIKPEYPDAHSNLGNVLLDLGRLDEAIAEYRYALALRPDFAEAHNNLANAFLASGQLNAAMASAQRASALKPDLAEAHDNLGTIYREQRRFDLAAAAYRKVVALRPDDPDAHDNLGAALRELGQSDEAIAEHRRALSLRPDSVEAWNNLGNVLSEAGAIDEAIAAYRRAVECGGGPRIGGNLLLALHYHPDYDAKRILDEHLRWNERFGRPLSAEIRPHENDADADRRLRVGYVSPDFREHPVGRFILPLLANHDHNVVEVFCYSDVVHRDALTVKLRGHANVWRDAVALSDERLADLIRSDRIDVLVDLAMHAGRNRLPVFARKPAPVQVTYLAYAGTTGLSTMDYRLTDRYLDPPDGQSDEFYTERSLCLPNTYWCYAPPTNAGDVGPLPTSASGHITFGCLNNFRKVSEPALATWCHILRQLSGSRLILHAHAGAHRDRVRARFAAEGVDSSRVAFVGFESPSRYFAQYNQIDVALDPFPYPGGTTTCDALWMGVPVVSLAGRTAVSRAGLSILSNAGLPELVAQNPEQYVQIAQNLAVDVPRLTELRATIRGRMRSSPLMNAAQFARDVEAAFRQMWRNWCAARNPVPSHKAP